MIPVLTSFVMMVTLYDCEDNIRNLKPGYSSDFTKVVVEDFKIGDSRYFPTFS